MTLRRLPDVAAPPGATISLTFALPLAGFRESLLKVQGVVVSDHLDGTFRRTGVRFASLAAETTRLLIRYCHGHIDDAGYGSDAALSANG